MIVAYRLATSSGRAVASLKRRERNRDGRGERRFLPSLSRGDSSPGRLKSAQLARSAELRCRRNISLHQTRAEPPSFRPRRRIIEYRTSVGDMCGTGRARWGRGRRGNAHKSILELIDMQRARGTRTETENGSLTCSIVETVSIIVARSIPEQVSRDILSPYSARLPVKKKENIAG